MPPARPADVAAPPAEADGPAWDLGAIAAAWLDWAVGLPVELASKLDKFRPVAVEGANRLALEPLAAQNWLVDSCDRPETRAPIESAIRRWLGRPVQLEFRRAVEAPGPRPASARPAPGIAPDDDLGDDWLVKLVVEKLDAKKVRVDKDDDPGS